MNYYEKVTVDNTFKNDDINKRKEAFNERWSNVINDILTTYDYSYRSDITYK